MWSFLLLLFTKVYVGNGIPQRITEIRKIVTVHTPLSREVFWHKYTKIPRHTARLYAISIKSVHRVACYWARSEQ